MIELGLVSVIMPNYNGAKYIRQSIESVLSQTYGSFELIVVDDKSTDASLEIIRSLAEIDSRIKLIEQKINQGVAIARNTGIDEARGEYIALLDSDDLWVPKKLERQIELIKEGADIVYSSYDFIDMSGNSIKRPFIVPNHTSYRDMLSCNVIGCSTVLTKAKILKKYKFSNDFYHEDYVLWMSLLKDELAAVGDTSVLMHYRVLQGSKSNNKSNAARERWKIYREKLQLNLFQSIYYYFKYVVNGIIKHYI